MPLSQLVHKVVSPLLYGLGIYQRHWQKLSKDKACVAVIYYHRIVASSDVNNGLLSDEVGIPADMFEQQMRFMLKHFTPIKPSQVLATQSTPGLYFAVTFDDGFEDNYSIAAPILKKLGISGGFYVVSDYVDTEKLFWWEALAYILKHTSKDTINVDAINSQLLDNTDLSPTISLVTTKQKYQAQKSLALALRQGPPDHIPQFIDCLSQQLDVDVSQSVRSHPLMSWQQLMDLQNQGFEIGGHTASHINLGKALKSDYQHEIVESTALLTKKLDKTISTFAYPYGRFANYTKEASQAVKEAGYQCAFTTNHGIVTQKSDPMSLPRLTLNKHWSFACAYNVANAFKLL